MRFHEGLIIAILTASAQASTLNIGFEAPGYSLGQVAGQQGWINSGLYDAQVTSADSYQGTQSLRISNGTASNTFGDMPFTPQLAVPAGESSVPGAVDTFLSSWYFKSVTGALQDGLGVTVSADSGTGTRMTYLRMADDATNGMNLQFYDFSGSPEDFVFQQLATNIDRSVWHRIDMNIYFLDGPGNDIVKIYLDGILQVTGTTWEDYHRSLGSPGPLPPVNSLMFRTGTAAAPATLGQGFYVDNIDMTSVDSPEPGTVGLMLTGVMGLLLRSTRSVTSSKQRSYRA